MKSLREWRTGRLLSMRELARSAGVSTQTLVDLEHGRRVASFGTMRLVSRALDVPVAEVSEFATAIETRSRMPAEPRPTSQLHHLPRGGDTGC